MAPFSMFGQKLHTHDGGRTHHGYHEHYAEDEVDENDGHLLHRMGVHSITYVGVGPK
jgi:hypothetical protein